MFVFVVDMSVYVFGLNCYVYFLVKTKIAIALSAIFKLNKWVNHQFGINLFQCLPLNNKKASALEKGKIILSLKGHFVFASQMDQITSTHLRLSRIAQDKFMWC